MTKGKIILGLLGVAIIAAPVIAFTRAESSLKLAAETYGPDYLGVSVKLDGVSISPIAGEARIMGLIIGNPAGFESTQAFSLDEISIKLSPTSIFTNHVRVQEILIDQPNIIWEIVGGKTNIQVLQSNISSATGGGNESENVGPVVSIDQLIVRDAQVSLVGLPVKQDTILKIPEIRLTNLGTAEGGISPAQVGQELFDALAPAIAREIAGSQLEGLTSDLKDRGEEAAGKLQEKAEEAIKDKLGGLLRRKKKDE